MILRQTFPGIVVAFVVTRMLRPVEDPDTFWHLRIGKELPSTWQFVGEDPWNSFATREWVLHEWLPELALAQAERAGGLAAVSVLMVVSAAVLLAILVATARQFTSLLVSALLAALCFIAMAPSLSPRPHVVTFACAAVTTTAWLRTLSDGRVRWWLIPLTWFWVCSHGMWFIGVAIGVVVLLGMFLDSSRRALAVRSTPVVIGSLVVAALTPAGFATFLAPLTVRGYTSYVAEWAPPTIFNPSTVCALLLVAVPVVGWALAARPAVPAELLLVFLAAGITLAYSRSVAVGAAIAVPLAARAISDYPFPRESWTRREVLVGSGLVAFAIAAMSFEAPRVASQAGGMPIGFSEFLDARPGGTVVCNSYELGGWLHWRHPSLQPVIDGRTELYEPSYVESAVTWERAGPRWEGFVQRSGCDVAIVPTESSILLEMEDDLGWRQLDQQRSWSLLVAPGR